METSLRREGWPRRRRPPPRRRGSLSLPGLRDRSRGRSTRSNKLPFARSTLSKGFLSRLPDAAGTIVRRIGWPLAFAPSNSLIAVRASLSRS